MTKPSWRILIAGITMAGKLFASETAQRLRGRATILRLMKLSQQFSELFGTDTI
jgi:hypothetical protein